MLLTDTQSSRAVLLLEHLLRICLLWEPYLPPWPTYPLAARPLNGAAGSVAQTSDDRAYFRTTKGPVCGDY